MYGWLLSSLPGLLTGCYDSDFETSLDERRLASNDGEEGGSNVESEVSPPEPLSVSFEDVGTLRRSLEGEVSSPTLHRCSPYSSAYQVFFPAEQCSSFQTTGVRHLYRGCGEGGGGNRGCG